MEIVLGRKWQMEIVTLEAVAIGDRYSGGSGKWISSLWRQWQMEIVTGTVTVTVI